MITTDRDDPGLHKIKDNGQQESYLVLSEEERAQGFVRPVRRSYMHKGLKVEGPIEVLDLTTMAEGDVARYKKWGYYAFMKYGKDKEPALGRYLSREQYDSIKDGYYGGCGQITTMHLAIAETYARDPKFYGATFCGFCGNHKPVEEFVWIENGEVTTQVLGS